MTLESLTYNLKEEQKARVLLESRLNEKRQKRRSIELVLEKVNTKLSQVRDCHTKMTETMKIAQHKVAQMQAQLDSNEASNKEKRDKLQSIDQKMNHLNEKRKKNMHKFEEELSKTAKGMIQAKDFYRDEKLREKIEECKAEYDRHQVKSEQINEEAASLKKYLASLEKQTQNKGDQVNKQEVLNIFAEEQKSMVKCLENLNVQLQSVRSSLKKQAEVDKELQH